MELRKRGHEIEKENSLLGCWIQSNDDVYLYDRETQEVEMKREDELCFRLVEFEVSNI